MGQPLSWWCARRPRSILTIVKLISIFLNLGVPLLATAISAAAPPAPDVHAIAQAVDERYNHLHSLQAEFTEIYRGAGMERTESGTLWLKNLARCVGNTVLREISCS